MGTLVAKSFRMFSLWKTLERANTGESSWSGSATSMQQVARAIEQQEALNRAEKQHQELVRDAARLEQEGANREVDLQRCRVEQTGDLARQEQRIKSRKDVDIKKKR